MPQTCISGGCPWVDDAASPAGRCDDARQQGSTMTSPEQENPSALTLTSPDLPGGTFPREFTCDGANRRPRLEWGAPPSGTQELAIEMLDPDAPGGTFTHWL